MNPTRPMLPNSHTGRALTIAAALLCVTTPLSAQSQPAVATPPALGTAPELRLPEIQTATLPNGLRLQVVEMHSIPLVQATLSIHGGARLDGPFPGRATFSAGMLTEGAGTRDAFALADEVDYLGASLSADASWDATRIHLGSPRRTFAQAMGLLADVLLRPTFNSADIARERDLRLARLLQLRDQPSAVAAVVLSRAIYPEGHPYHHPIDGDSSSIVAFDSALIRDYWNRAADPRQATLTIAGAITLEEAKALAAEHLGDWSAPAQPLTPPPADEIPVAPRTPTRVIVVDKPGAAQSVISIGAPGVARTTPDYPAITVMNTILGGSFSARLNDILREQKGYTYGAGSRFTWRPVPGPFTAGAAVRTNVTDSSLAIFFREFETIRETAPTAEELERALALLTLGPLGDFETTRHVTSQLVHLNTLGLDLATITSDLAAFREVTALDVQRAAERYIDPNHLTVVIVGDLATIRPGIEALRLGPILEYDHHGRPVH